MAAPVIILGRVVSVVDVGGVRRAAADNRLAVQLVQITAAVDLVIKGKVTGSNASFYFFKYSNEGPAELRRRRYFPEIGQKRIFFGCGYFGTTAVESACSRFCSCWM